MVDDETLDHIRRELGKMHPYDLKKLLPGRRTANKLLKRQLDDIALQLARGEAIVSVIEELIDFLPRRNDGVHGDAGRGESRDTGR